MPVIIERPFTLTLSSTEMEVLSYLVSSNIALTQNDAEILPVIKSTLNSLNEKLEKLKK